jgi:tetratricopeptide (TPR) repeat protein
MIVKRAVGFTALLLGATSLAAAQDRWIAPKCDVKPGHFMVNSGLLYLRSATNTNFQSQREKDLRDAQRTLVQAITQNSQDKNGAAWYYLARYYGLSEQLMGADSAFRRAEALLPACKDDIAGWRKILWQPVFNQGVQAFNAQKMDSAKYYFEMAAAINPEPIGLGVLAGLFANANQVDSALLYYKRAAEAAGSDTEYTKERREAMYNVAAILYQNQRWSEAAGAFRSYLVVYPTDVQAMAALASAHNQNGHTDSALAIYRQILERADSAEPAALFAAGAAMFNAAPPQPDTAASAAECRKAAKTPADRRKCDQEARVARAQHDSLAKSTYRMAVRAFEAGLARAPHSRDGLYNSVSTYYLLGDSARIVPAVRRLIAIDPMNRSALRLAAAAYQMRGVVDSTVYYVTQAESLLVVDVTVQSFRPGEQGAAWQALVTNFHDKPSAALQLTVEFLNTKGEVVATQPGDVPSLPSGGMHDLQLQAAGAGITAWRYRKAG